MRFWLEKSRFVGRFSCRKTTPHLQRHRCFHIYVSAGMILTQAEQSCPKHLGNDYERILKTLEANATCMAAVGQIRYVVDI